MFCTFPDVSNTCSHFVQVFSKLNELKYLQLANAVALVKPSTTLQPVMFDQIIPSENRIVESFTNPLY